MVLVPSERKEEPALLFFTLGTSVLTLTILYLSHALVGQAAGWDLTYSDVPGT